MPHINHPRDNIGIGGERFFVFPIGIKLSNAKSFFLNLQKWVFHSKTIKDILVEIFVSIHWILWLVLPCGVARWFESKAKLSQVGAHLSLAIDHRALVARNDHLSISKRGALYLYNLSNYENFNTKNLQFSICSGIPWNAVKGERYEYSWVVRIGPKLETDQWKDVSLLIKDLLLSLKIRLKLYDNN